MKLSKHEVICPNCKGERYTEYKENRYYTSKKLCFKCGGEGKLDWVDCLLNRNVFDGEIDHWNHDSKCKVTSTPIIISQEIVL